MFLLHDELIRRYKAREGLQIDPFHHDCCRDSAYYFRLGELAVSQKTQQHTVLSKKTDFIEIQPFESYWVKSRERFRLPDRVWIQIGQPTSLATERTLMLIHGPSINPGYGASRSTNPGEEQEAVPIEVVLLNFGPQPVKVHFNDEIGKLTFFDISDSALEEVRALGLQTREREARLRRANPYFGPDENPDAGFQTNYV